SVSAAGLGRSGPGSSVPFVPPVGVLRFGLPVPRGSGLLRAPLAPSRDRSAARGGLALLGAGSASGRISAAPDRSLPPECDSGLRLDRTAPRERSFLGTPSGMAGENRVAPGRPPRLAQAHEPEQPRGVRRNLAWTARSDRAFRLGRGEPGRAVFRVARRSRKSCPVHAHE